MTRNNTKQIEIIRDFSCYFAAENKTELPNPIGDENVCVACFGGVSV